MDWPETREVVFQDPLLFDLARQQVAVDIEEEPDRDRSISQEMATAENAARLLRSDRPQPGQGLRPGRKAIALLTEELLDAICVWNSWSVPEKRTDKLNVWSSWPTDHGFSEVLADRLNAHPLLADFPEAVPSSEDVRNALRARGIRR